MLAPGIVTSWDELTQAFLNKFFLPSKMSKFKMEIGTFKQKTDEQQFEAWEHYKELLRKCPQHGYPDWLKFQLFYNEFSGTTKSVLDVKVGGSIFSKTANVA